MLTKNFAYFVSDWTGDSHLTHYLTSNMIGFDVYPSWKVFISDLFKTWDKTLVNFFNFGVTRFFLDSKMFIYVFPDQSC